MSSSGPKAGALLVAVLQLSTQLALGGRSHLQGREGGGDDAEGLLPDREGTCGGPEVWHRLTGDPSVEGVQNINWQKVDAVIEERLAAWSGKIAKLEVETQGLEARVAEKKAGEGGKAMPTKDVTRLIMEGLRPFSGADVDLQNARDTRCGKPDSRPRAPRGAYRSSQMAFRAAAGKYFKKKVRCSREDFLAECGRLLPAGSTDDVSYCEPLCLTFWDTARLLCDVVVAEKKAGEVPTEDVTRLITEGLRPFSGADVGLQNARDTMCGKPGIGPQAPRGAYTSSQEAFAAAAGEYFKEKVRCSREDFLAECGGLLFPAESGEQESYCPQLCQTFWDTAQELCDAVSDKLDEELEQKLEELAAARSTQSTCEGARDFISGFEARLGDYQVAEENLEGASWSLDAAEEALIRCGCLAVVPPPSSL